MYSNTALLYSYLTNPREAVRYVLDHPPTLFITFIFLFAVANAHIASSLNSLLSGEALNMFLTMGFLLKLAGFLFFLLVLTSVIHFTSDLFSATGSVSSLYLTFMLSFTPMLLATPLYFLFGSNYVFFWFILLIWVVLLQIKAVQEVYRFSFFQAIMAYIVPVLLLIVVTPLFLFAIFVVSLLIGLSSMQL